MSEPPRPGDYEVLETETVHEGRVITLVKDTVAMPEGGSSVREIVRLCPSIRTRRRLGHHTSEHLPPRRHNGESPSRDPGQKL